MPLPWACVLAAAGFALGPRQRASVFRHAAPCGRPARRCCPACARPLLPGRWRFWPALPVTGRCPGCGDRIGPAACTVECATAITLGLLGSRLGPGLVLAAVAWLASCAVPLAAVDVAARRLPDRLTVPAYLGTAGLLAAAAWAAGRPGELVRAAAGGAALAGFYLALFVISPAGMGLGDAKMSASLGTALSWFGWNVLLAGAFAGFLLGGAFAVTLVAARRAGRKQHMPFGPFMIAGSFLVILAGVR